MDTTHKRKRTMDQEKARRRINIQRVTATDSTTTSELVSILYIQTQYV
jgi:hypothetical protein